MNSVYHRDFDAELEDEARAAERARIALYTPDDLAAAAQSASKLAYERGLAEGHSRGHSEAMTEIEARRAAALEALLPKLDRMLAERLEHRTALEAQMLDFTLSVCERVLPDFLDQHAPHAAAAEIRRVIALALNAPRLRIRLSPQTRDLMAPEIEALTAARLAPQQTEITADASLAPGNAHVAWDDGFAEYSYAAVCDEILAALKEATAMLTPSAVKETADTKKAR